MAVVDRIEGSDWLVVWKRDSDARAGQAKLATPEGTAILVDGRACNATLRLILPLPAQLDGVMVGQLDIALELRAEKASQARPVEWIALLQGPSADDLGIARRLENLPAIAANGRRWNWSFARGEWPEAKGALYLALQLAPRSQPVLVDVELRPTLDAAATAPSALPAEDMPDAQAAPKPDPALSPPADAAPLVEAFSWAEAALPASPATPRPGGTAPAAAAEAALPHAPAATHEADASSAPAIRAEPSPPGVAPPGPTPPLAAGAALAGAPTPVPPSTAAGLIRPGAAAPEEPGAAAREEHRAAAPEEPGAAVPEELGAAVPEEPGAAVPEEPCAAARDEPGAFADTAWSSEQARMASPQAEASQPGLAPAPPPAATPAAPSAPERPGPPLPSPLLPGPAQPGPAQRRRVRPLIGEASVVFRSAADAQACVITIEDATRGIIQLDPSRCEKDVRVILPLPPQSLPDPLPPGLCLPFGLGLQAAELGPRENRTLLWLGVTQGASPVSLEMHLLLTKRIRAKAQLEFMAWHGGLDPVVEPGAALYATLQLAGGGAPVRFTLPEPVASPSGGQWLEGEGLLAQFAEGVAPGRILLHRSGRSLTAAPRALAGPAGEARLWLPPAELASLLHEAGWADGGRVEALLLSGDTLLDRRELRIHPVREEGGLREATVERIRGWAALAGQPEQGVPLELLVNGEAYQFLTARGEFETRLLLTTTTEGDVVELRGRLTGQRLGPPMRLTGLPRRVMDPARALRATLGLRERRPGVSVIVPLRDGDAEAARCLAALRAHGPASARVFLVDHGCTSPAMTALIAAHDPACVLRAEGGRAAACNRGIAAAGRDDVVLLMPEAAPGPRWLQRLVFAALAGDSLASVSALPPEIAHRAAPLWQEWGAEDAQRLVAQAAGGLLPGMPAMQGACLYLRRAALDEVGAFDAAGFPDDDGWQADWSLRARYLGYAHGIEDGCLMGVTAPLASPTQEALLGHRYAEWPRLREAALADPAWLTLSHRLAITTRDALAGGARPRPRWLFALGLPDPDLEAAELAFIAALDAVCEPLLLRCTGREMQLSRLTAGAEALLATHRLRHPLGVLDHRSAEMDAVVTEWMQGEAVEGLHIRHIAGHSLGLVERARLLELPVVLALRDFYPVCPNAALLDAQMQACGGLCTAGAGDCQPAFWPRDAVPPLRDRWVHNWRAMLGPVLAQCDALLLPSDAARDSVLRIFPALDERRFHVLGAPNQAAPVTPPAPRPGEPLRVLVVGDDANLARLQREASALDAKERLEILRMREAQPAVPLPPAHLAAILSPEVEAALPMLWSAGLPVLTLEGGAAAAAIRQTGGGWVLADATPQAIHKALLRIAADIEGHAARAAAVQAWSQGEGRWAGLMAAAAACAALHARLGAAARPAPSREA
ncbi:glycosyltransferase [Sediminicoccus sp. KRV36]|uniref:glycosyltransferase n=1 Tax=Sediminicoccus sp. KRV36 TaxID=3133721 RepID=UPI00200E8480|nr:glycosyltransferase [Sediminicoccus rosea]UPY36956.1 glycosyltransferase [Sediminicoccus rosea]